jgi:hypothetical protein
MKLINKLERKFGNLVIPNLTLFLIFAQACTLLYSLTPGHEEFAKNLSLNHDAVFAGEWWRIFSFVIMPALTSPAFLIFFLMFYFLMGTALEREWGEFKYNLFFLTGYLATVLTVLIPGADVSNFYLMESIFLAFAWLYPNYRILLFFILPVEVKWVAAFVWITYVIQLARGDWGTKAAVLAGIFNFVLFFHADLLDWARTSRRKFNRLATQTPPRDPGQPMHVCAECGVSDLSDRKMEFRYCPQCKGTPAYCINHIQTHQHR